MSDNTPKESPTASSTSAAKKSTSAAKKSPAKKPVAKKSATPSDGVKDDPSTVDTDKPEAESASVKDDTQVATDDSESETTNQPLTAGDYARTTRPSPATTSVIPAVRDSSRHMPQPKVTVEPDGQHREAHLKLSHVDPWSVTKLAFAVSVALMVVSVVAVTIFWIVLNAAGVWDQINEAVTKVLSDNPSSFDITEYLGFGRLVGLTLVLSAINVVLMTALATISAHLYNLASQLLGGIEVTFSDEH